MLPRTLLLTIVGALIAACGASTPPISTSATTTASGAPASVACALISRAEAANAAGTAVGAGTETTTNGSAVCRFPDAAGTVVVAIAVAPDRSLFDRLDRQSTAVAGVGDAAYTAAGSLVVLVGKRTLVITVTRGSKGAELGLAAVIVPRMREAVHVAP